ncbi:MAG: threonylcarbamoyl-AMP synthase [Deltaproteobacteria bacterium]|jgi:L-threonylcarbamoyladenylate synthase|nr:threonylcarbamoyl-AMP synthase [Deltaproteobacteria bacterium]
MKGITPEIKALSLQEALRAITGDRLLIYPTETFYAIGGNALSAGVLSSVYEAKGRDGSRPLPLLIGDLEQLRLVAAGVEEEEGELMRLFWPGPLTLLLRASPGLPAPLAGGAARVAVRLSGHPTARELSRRAGLPLISSSANRSGFPPASSPEEVDRSLLRAAGGALCLEGPAPAGGLPSTIVRLEGRGSRVLRLLRAGAVSAAQLRRHGFKVISEGGGAVSGP